jgi:hypothetical protein
MALLLSYLEISPERRPSVRTPAIRRGANEYDPTILRQPAAALTAARGVATTTPAQTKICVANISAIRVIRGAEISP